MTLSSIGSAIFFLLSSSSRFLLFCALFSVGSGPLLCRAPIPGNNHEKGGEGYEPMRNLYIFFYSAENFYATGCNTFGKKNKKSKNKKVRVPGNMLTAVISQKLPHHLDGERPRQ